MTDGRQYQAAKDGYPDAPYCAECGVVIEPWDVIDDRSPQLCPTCEWDANSYRVGEEE